MHRLELHGLPTSPDSDHDGIPDGWETHESAALSWGGFEPRPNQTDVLVEFILVTGPSSGRQHAGFDEAYERVREVFAGQDLVFQYEETLVTWASEPEPPLLPTLFTDYYASVLSAATYSGNPFVLTVVLNPQHDQRTVLHGGIAPIGGFLSAIDYGLASNVVYEGPDYRLRLTPMIESLILRGDLHALAAAGHGRAGLTTDGFFLQTGDRFLEWSDRWFWGLATTPPSGEKHEPRLLEANVDAAALARAILHELGHSLGLCHPHAAGCPSRAPHETVMGQERTAHASGYSEDEWATIRAAVACPPAPLLERLATTGVPSTILEAKYGYDVEQMETIELRTCP